MKVLLLTNPKIMKSPYIKLISKMCDLTVFDIKKNNFTKVSIVDLVILLTDKIISKKSITYKTASSFSKKNKIKMIEVAKLDSNNKIVNTFAIHKAYGTDATGEITQSKIKEYCVANFGGTADEYIGNLPNVGGMANKDDIYDADKNCFHEPRPKDMTGAPCSSWELQDDGSWKPGHNYVRNLDDGNDFNYEEHSLDIRCLNGRKF